MENIEHVKDTLRKWLPQGAIVWTLRSKGLAFQMFCIHGSRIINLTSHATVACGRKRKDTFVMKGHGYNHPRAAIEDLANALYGDTRALEWGESL